MQMVVFSDSNADTGRRFNAPASFDFEDIGPFPWKKLFDGPDSHVRQPHHSQNLPPPCAPRAFFGPRRLPNRVLKRNANASKTEQMMWWSFLRNTDWFLGVCSRLMLPRALATFASSSSSGLHGDRAPFCGFERPPLREPTIPFADHIFLPAPRVAAALPSGKNACLPADEGHRHQRQSVADLAPYSRRELTRLLPLCAEIPYYSSTVVEAHAHHRRYRAILLLVPRQHPAVPIRLGVQHVTGSILSTPRGGSPLLVIVTDTEQQPTPIRRYLYISDQFRRPFLSKPLQILRPCRVAIG